MFEPETIERFLANVDRRSGEECWPWLGSKEAKSGRGRFHVGKALIASRYMWALHNGRQIPPPDQFICHSCDNPNCVNPAHLWLGSNSDNLRDCVSKGRHPIAARTHCDNGHPYEGVNLGRSKRGERICRICDRKRKYRWLAANPRAPYVRLTPYRQRGEAHASAKLTADKVREARETYDRTGLSHKSLAARFGVSTATMSYALNRKTWKHVP